MNPLAAITATFEVSPREMLASGVPNLDALTGGFPRGGITEIVGPESSGRTTLAHALLAAATTRGEICCHIDTSDAFDPVSAAQAGTVLSQLIWVRCGGHAEHAFKAADAILHAGGFGVVLLDLARISERAANRIPVSYWYRFRRAIENTSTVLALVEKNAMARSCASLLLDLKRDATYWRGAAGFELFRGMEIGVTPRKPAGRGKANIDVLLCSSR
jgi:recombination protein RecA